MQRMEKYTHSQETNSKITQMLDFAITLKTGLNIFKELKEDALNEWTNRKSQQKYWHYFLKL